LGILRTEKGLVPGAPCLPCVKGGGFCAAKRRRDCCLFPHNPPPASPEPPLHKGACLRLQKQKKDDRPCQSSFSVVLTPCRWNRTVPSSLSRSP
jgi:hypothetical protein